MIDYDGLNRLAYQIKTETGRAANTALRVGTLFEDIIDALREGDNTGLLDQITNLKNDISKIINMIKDLNNEIDTSIITRIEANERNISNINNTIQGINTTISSIQGDINTINGTLSNHTTLIDGLQGQITTINNSITEIGTQISNITNTISTITSDLIALTTRVSKNETNIAELKKRLDAIDLEPIIAAINKLNVDLDALTERVSTAEIEINSLRTSVDNISNNLAEEVKRARAAEEALDKKFDLYLPLTAGSTKPLTDRLYFKDGSNVYSLGSAQSTINPNSKCLSFGIPSATWLEIYGGQAKIPGQFHCNGLNCYDADLYVYGTHGFIAGETVIPKIRFSQYNPAQTYGEISIPSYQTLRISTWMSNGANQGRIQLEASNIFKRDKYLDKNYKIWSEDNDGHESGLDADLLDGHHWTEISSTIKGYLPLSGGTMTGTIVLPKSSNNSHLGIAAGPSSSDVFLGYDDISNFFGSTNKVTEVLGPVISIGANSKVSVGSNDEVSVIAVNKLFLQGASQLVMKTPTIYWTTDSTDGMKLISNKTNIGFDVFNTTYDPTLLVKTKVKLKTASSGSTSYEMLHEGNSVYVVSSYPTDLSSYPDGAIFIKTS